MTGTSRATNLPAGTELAAWARDSEEAFVSYSGVVPNRIDRVDLHTGKRTLVREIAPEDRAGLLRMSALRTSADGRASAYSFWKRRSTLFVAKEASASK